MERGGCAQTVLEQQCSPPPNTTLLIEPFKRRHLHRWTELSPHSGFIRLPPSLLQICATNPGACWITHAHAALLPQTCRHGEQDHPGHISEWKRLSVSCNVLQNKRSAWKIFTSCLLLLHPAAISACIPAAAACVENQRIKSNSKARLLVDAAGRVQL